MNIGGGERKLLIAILERAIVDYAYELKREGLGGGKRLEYQPSAYAWLFCWDDGYKKKPFTFAWVCVELDIDPHALKRKIPKIIENPEILLRGRTHIHRFDPGENDEYASFAKFA